MNWKFIYPSNQRTRGELAFSLGTVYLSSRRNVECFIERNQVQQILVCAFPWSKQGEELRL